jgi:hypothetical protein
MLHATARPTLRVGLCLVMGALAASAALLPGAMVAGARPGQHFHQESLLRVGATVVRNLPQAASGSHATHLHPLVTRHLGNVGSSTTGSAVRVVSDGAAAIASTSATATENVLASFPGMSLDAQISGVGADQNVAPPDTQLAAGPTSLLEMVNDSGSVWSKTGTRTSAFDLNAFFHVPAGQTFSDPRVVFDAPTGRWFASGLSFTASYGSQVYVAVSSTSDPSDGWTIYSGGASSNVLHDQPKIGVSADKLVMSWNDFLSASFFEGATTWVIQKSDLLAAAASVGVSAAGPDSRKSSPVPVQDLSYSATDTTAYDVYNTPPNIGVLAITGTPAQGNVSMTETDLSIGATSSPPSADQPGAAGSIDTNDDRFLSAVWQGGTLWTAGNDACVSSGDSATRPCARFVAVSTAGPAVSQDFDLGSSGADLYYPAVTLDSGGDMAATYAISSTSVYPGVRVIAQVGGSLTAAQTLQTGQALYNDDPCYNVSGPSRWGDYSAAAVDPSNPADVWIGGEYSVASTLAATTGCAWATFAAQLTVAAQQGTPTPSESPSSLAFANQLVSTTSSAQQVTVSNASTATGSLTVSSISVAGSNASDFIVPPSSDLCTGHTLSPGSSCTVGVDFSPTATGARSATLDVNDNAAGSPQTVALSGTGLDFGVASTPTSVRFAVAKSGQFTVTVTPTPGFAASFSVTSTTSSSRLRVSPATTSCTTSGAACTTSSFTLTATKTGTYTVTVSVTYGGVTHRISVAVTVTRT